MFLRKRQQLNLNTIGASLPRLGFWLAILSVALWSTSHYSDAPLGHVVLNMQVAPLLLTLSLLFVTFRARLWQKICRMHGLSMTMPSSMAVLYRSALVDVCVFPSRISSDVYRYAVLDNHCGSRLSICLLYRLISALPIAPVIFLSAAHQPQFLALIASTIALLLLIPGIRSKAFRYLSDIDRQHLSLMNIFPLVLLALVPALIELIRLSILVQYISGVKVDLPAVSLDLLSAQLLGALSGVPLGLGVRDWLSTITVTGPLSTPQILAVTVTARLTGELFSAFLGWLISFRDLAGKSDE